MCLLSWRSLAVFLAEAVATTAVLAEAFSAFLVASLDEFTVSGAWPLAATATLADTSCAHADDDDDKDDDDKDDDDSDDGNDGPAALATGRCLVVQAGSALRHARVVRWLLLVLQVLCSLKKHLLR